MQINSPATAPDFSQLMDDHRNVKRPAALLLTGKVNAPK